MDGDLFLKGEELVFTVVDEQFPFGYEFYSSGQLTSFIPASDKCFISIVLAMAAQKNCCLVGEAGVGKTETVKVSQLQPLSLKLHQIVIIDYIGQSHHNI